MSCHSLVCIHCITYLFVRLYPVPFASLANNITSQPPSCVSFFSVFFSIRINVKSHQHTFLSLLFSFDNKHKTYTKHNITNRAVTIHHRQIHHHHHHHHHNKLLLLHEQQVVVLLPLVKVVVVQII